MKFFFHLSTTSSRVPLWVTEQSSMRFNLTDVATTFWSWVFQEHAWPYWRSHFLGSPYSTYILAKVIGFCFSHAKGPFCLTSEDLWFILVVNSYFLFRKSHFGISWLVRVDLNSFVVWLFYWLSKYVLRHSYLLLF